MVCRPEDRRHFRPEEIVVAVHQVIPNAADSETYSKVCRPRFGENTFAGVVKFAREVARYVPSVVLSVVEGTIPHEDVDRCRNIAESVGATFRLRPMQ